MLLVAGVIVWCAFMLHCARRGWIEQEDATSACLLIITWALVVFAALVMS